MEASFRRKVHVLWLTVSFICIITMIHTFGYLSSQSGKITQYYGRLFHNRDSFYESISDDPDISPENWESSVIKRYWTRLSENTMDKVMKDTIGEGIEQDDPKLLENMKQYFIDSPSPYITKFSYPLFKTPLTYVVDQVLKEKENGVFVECGANDGERSSNTIFLENKRNWTGLLIEMDPAFYLQILGKNRKAYSMNACISTQKYPSKMKFQEHFGGKGQLVPQNSTGSLVKTAYCFPFFSMMLALDISHIDYFSLDVEGAELDILKTIPYDKLDISVISAEWVHGEGGMDAYVDFMKTKGYVKHAVVKEVDKKISLYLDDIVFVKESFLQNNVEPFR